jgi:hypothetical protein
LQAALTPGKSRQHHRQRNEDEMHIDLNEAIRIHARVGRARFGGAARKRALKTAENLRRAGDHIGAAVWERLAAEIDRAGGNRVRPRKDALSAC